MIRALPSVLPLAAGLLLGATASAQVTSYCVGAPNSVGPGASIAWAGPVTLSQGGLAVTGLPRGVTGLFIYGRQRDQAPFGDGFRCIGGPSWILARKRSALDGTVPLDFISEGELEDVAWLMTAPSWAFQYLYRDPATIGAGGAGFNATNAIGVVLGP